MTENELKELISSLDKYCLDRILPTAEDDDEKSLFREDLFQGLGELGFTGVTTDEQF